jgi:serine/threonine-protein kinase
MAYFLLTGRPPFQKETPLEMLLAHAYEPPPPLVDAPEDLATIVLRCLNKKPEDRFGDVDTLEKALAACRNAGDWTEDQAREWWQHHGTEAAETAALDSVPTHVTAPAPVAV